jgi:hypothetical protein
MVVEVQERIRQIWDQNSKCFTVFTGHLYSRCWEPYDYFL